MGTPAHVTRGSASGAASTPIGAGRHRVTLSSGGLQRSAIVYLPPGTHRHARPPLVLNLHGSGSGPLEQLRLSELETTAARYGFVVVAPQAAVPAGAGHAWNVPHVGFAQRAVGAATASGAAASRAAGSSAAGSGTAGSRAAGPGAAVSGAGGSAATASGAAGSSATASGAASFGAAAGRRTGPVDPDDERFLLDLVDAVVDAGYADPQRVFATGLSGGGRMLSQLAADHPGRLAAIAPVAGLRAGAPSAADPRAPDLATFAPEVPVPVVTFHGTADPSNPFGGGGEPYWGYSAATALARWAELNGCARGPVEERLTEHVRVISYSACAQAADAVMYVIEGGGHTWPGSRATIPAHLGPVTLEISANELMWRFFAGRSR